MKTFWKNIFVISLLSLSLFGCGGKEEEITERMERNLPDQEAFGVVITRTEENRLTMALYAQHVNTYEERNFTEAESVYVVNYGKNNEVTTIKANNAEVDDAKNTLKAIGNVVVTSENGIMKTQELIWDRATNLINAPGNVTLLRDDNLMQGVELNTDVNLTFVKMKRVTASGTLANTDISW